MKAEWQEESLSGLSTFFRRDRRVRALVLTGSMATPGATVDDWSDVDLKIILAAAALPEYYDSVAWVARFGELLASDRVESDYGKTLRLCLTPFRRFDLTFIPESVLKTAATLRSNPFGGNRRIVWSRLPKLNCLIASIPPPAPFVDPSGAQLRKIAEDFWFKAAIAIAKAARRDLLVALHLALDLQRDCLLLQMLLRDRRLGTNVHRFGGWGDDIVAELMPRRRRKGSQQVLDVIERACACFDALSGRISPDYAARTPKFKDAMERARRLRTRET